MTTDRLERRLPEVLTELSLPRLPDYVDDIISRTERMPQRPGWTYLERWFPVSTMTDAFAAPRRLPLRPLIVAAVILALVAASIAFYFGMQRRPAPLLGLARNGVVVTTSATRDLIAVNPETGTQRTLAAGPDICCAQVSRDGLRVAFLNLPDPEADPTGLSIIDLDGKLLRNVPADQLRGLIDFDWSADGTRLLLTRDTTPRILDVATGNMTLLSVGSGILRASWIGMTGDILVTSRVSDSEFKVSRLPAGATTGATEIKRLQYPIDAPKVSPDGSRYFYFIWGPSANLQGRLHVVDLASGEDREVSTPEPAGTTHETEWENPTWSPDGSFIAAELYTTALNHVVVIPAGGGTPVTVGPEFPTGTGGVAMRFSPDGTSLLVTYRFNHTTWLLPVSGAAGRQVPWVVDPDGVADWQRLAP